MMLKNKLFLFILFCTISANSQSPILFNYQWQLTELRVNGTIYSPENYDNLPIIFLNLTGFPYYTLSTNVCGQSTAEVSYYGEDTNLFQVINYNHNAINCNSVAADDFENQYLNIFWKNYPMYSFTFTVNPVTLNISYGAGHYAKYIGLPLLNLANNTIESSVTIYPNPVINSFKIQSTQLLEISKVMVYNLSGECILENSHLVDNTVAVSNLPSGVYFVEIQTNLGNMEKKIVKL